MQDITLPRFSILVGILQEFQIMCNFERRNSRQAPTHVTNTTVEKILLKYVLIINSFKLLTPYKENSKNWNTSTEERTYSKYQKYKGKVNNQIVLKCYSAGKKYLKNNINKTFHC